MAACIPPKWRAAQMTIQLAYNLVTRDATPTPTPILDNVILLLWFSINPDGQNRWSPGIARTWARRTKSAPCPTSTRSTSGHDNNRDGYMNNMIESQAITRTELEYYPRSSTTITRPRPFPRASSFRRSASRCRSIRTR